MFKGILSHSVSWLNYSKWLLTILNGLELRFVTRSHTNLKRFYTIRHILTIKSMLLNYCKSFLNHSKKNVFYTIVITFLMSL